MSSSRTVTLPDDIASRLKVQKIMTIKPMCNDNTLIEDLKLKNRLNPGVNYNLTCSNSENYTVGKLLGEWRFNIVYTLVDSTGNEIPDRVIRITKPREENFMDIDMNELTGLFIQSVLSKPKDDGLVCNSICKVYDFGYLKHASEPYNTRVYAIIEKLKHPNLLDIFDPKKYIEKPVIKQIFVQILQGLECLSKNGYVHLDIKKENIGIDNDGNAKIIDFGFARYMSKEELEDTHRIVGTRGFRDPNYDTHDKISMNSDIYAVGAMLHSFTHTMLDKDGNITYTKNEQSKYNEYNEDPDYNDLKTRMMDPNPETRLTATEALQHKWINCDDYPSCDTESKDILENIAHYLSNVSAPHKYHVLHNSFGSTKCDYFKTVYDDIVIALGKLDPQLLGDLSQDKWEKCQGDCFKILTKYVKKEVESTAYMMRLIEASKLRWVNATLHFEFNCFNITGKWENDKDIVNMVVKPLTDAVVETPTAAAPKKPRLIMGFGPSASGKTYCAGEVIKLMQQVERLTFPDLFLSIDGGIYRECSVVYQLILQALKQVNDKVPGLKNLVFAGFHITSNIFDSGKIKKRVMNYLGEQKAKGNAFSLYVPETLGKCISLRKEFSYNTTCSSEYKDYITYTGDNDNWIGLMIWQHKTGADCTFDEEYKCKGCTESGESRETMEGKQYSSGAWDRSYKYGLLAAKDAPTYRFIIHNTGGRKHSVEGKEKFNTITFEDYSNYSEETAQRVQSAVNELTWKYVNKMQETSLSGPPVESNASEQEIQKNIESAKQILVAINKVLTKSIKEKLKSGGVDMQTIQYGGEPTVVDPDETLYNKIIQQIQNELPTFGVYSVNFFKKTLVPLLNENIKTDILKTIKDYGDTDAKQKYIVEQIDIYIKDKYLPSQKTMLTEHQLISMSMDILAKLSEKTDKSEDNGIKQLLEIALAIAFPEKSLSFDFKMPIILPEPSVRIGDLETMTTDIVPEHESIDKDGKVISVDKQTRERIDLTKTIYTEERPYTPAYYEHVLQSDGNLDELNKKIVDVTEKVLEAKGKVIEASTK